MKVATRSRAEVTFALVIRLLSLEPSWWMLRAVQKELETVDDPGDNHRDAALASVELNEEGFFLYPAQCTEAMVLTLAARVGISELSDRHWQVIRFTRNHFLEPGMGPTVRHLGKAWGSRSGSYTGTPASMS